MTIHGLILVGGKSSRMKEPKAHLSLNAIPQWQRAHDALALSCDQVYFSVSGHLDKPIPVPENKLIPDQVQSCGPLGGILSAFKKDAHSTWLVLACDMPYFSSDAASYLISSRNLNKLATCYANTRQQPEPLAALYEPAIFSYLLEYWGKGTYCPRRILESLDIELVKPLDEKLIANINYPHEWESLRVANSPRSYEVTIRYYASLKKASGCSQEVILTTAKTISELFNQLAYKHSFDLNESSLRFAKNDKLVSPNEPLAHGDSIVLIPPVSGG